MEKFSPYVLRGVIQPVREIHRSARTSDKSQRNEHMKPFTLYLMIGGGGLVALVLGIVLPGVLPVWRWPHEPLHSTLPASGGSQPI